MPAAVGKFAAKGEIDIARDAIKTRVSGRVWIAFLIHQSLHIAVVIVVLIARIPEIGADAFKIGIEDKVQDTRDRIGVSTSTRLTSAEGTWLKSLAPSLLPEGRRWPLTSTRVRLEPSARRLAVG